MAEKYYNGEEEVINLIELMKACLKNWKLIVVSTVLCAALGFIYTFYSFVPTYSYSTGFTLYVYEYCGAAASIVTSSTTIDQVEAATGIDASDIDISASSDIDYFTVEVTITGEDEEKLETFTNSLSEISLSEISNMFTEDMVYLVGVSSITETESDSPEYFKNMFVMALAGFVCSVAAVMLVVLFDRKLRSIQDLNRYHLSLLGVVEDQVDKKHKQDLFFPMLMGLIKKNARKKRVAFDEKTCIAKEGANPAYIDAYRQIRTSLDFITASDICSKILLASTVAGEGTTLTSVNLGMAYAANGKKTLLVECNLRNGEISKHLDITYGIKDVVSGSCALGDAIQHLDGGLDLLPCGQCPENPTELLDSKAMVELVDDLSKQYDTILFDSSALNEVSDALILTKYTTGTVLVVNRNIATFESLEESLRRLEMADAMIYGIVYNQA